eukprot:350888-Chlamydomonas_euryale.AAC.3
MPLYLRPRAVTCMHVRGLGPASTPAGLIGREPRPRHRPLMHTACMQPHWLVVSVVFAMFAAVVVFVMFVVFVAVMVFMVFVAVVGRVQHERSKCEQVGQGQVLSVMHGSRGWCNASSGPLLHAAVVPPCGRHKAVNSRSASPRARPRKLRRSAQHASTCCSVGRPALHILHVQRP